MIKRYFAVVTAAGIGTRMSSEMPKQYLPLQGKWIITHTVERLLQLDYIEKIVVVIAKTDTHWHTSQLAQHPKIISVNEGGQERCQTVWNGLSALAQWADPQDWVLVHDAVRPCVKIADIEKLVAQLHDHPVGGLLCVRASDTIKQCDTAGNVQSTLDRTQLWHAMTPQMFRYQLLQQALEPILAIPQAVTDEAGAIERIGYTPVVVEGCKSNIKITHPVDLQLAEFFLARYHDS